MALFRLFVINVGDDGRPGSEVGVAEDVAGRERQDERLGHHSGRTTGEAFAVGGNQSSAVLGCEQHTVEDLAGGVGGCTTGDARQTFHGGGRQLGHGADGGRARWEFAGIERGIHGGGRDTAAGERDAEFPAALAAAGSEGNLRAFVGAAAGLHRGGRDEEAGVFDGLIGDPGFKPQIKIGGGEFDAVLPGGEQQVVEHRQLATQMFEASEEFLRIAQGVGWDEDGGHGGKC